HHLFVGSTSDSIGHSAEGKTVTVQIPNVNAPKDYTVELTVSDGKFESNPPASLTLHVQPVQSTNLTSTNITK
ncbi:MAG TPA: hypothetical protein VH500_12475, partial [Nitrososphaeraceae archaeon]